MEKTAIELFNEDIEYGMYITFSVSYIKNNREVIKKSIGGEYEELNKSVPHRDLRKFESTDITWRGESSALDVYNNTMWSVVRNRMINLKISLDGYANNIQMEKGDFYKDLMEKCPSFIITIPNKETIHISDLLKIVRDEIVHIKENSKKKRLGITDLKRFLFTPLYIADDGKKNKIVAYNRYNPEFKRQNQAIMNETHCSLDDYMYSLIEKEYIQMIRMYDAIITGECTSEQEGIDKNYWIPIKFIID